MKVVADRAAAEAMRSGHAVALPAILEGDRRIVRDHLRWRVDLVARSEGESPERYIVPLPI